MNLSKDVKISQVLGYSAAGQVAKTSNVIDMQGFAGVVFVACLGTVSATSVVILKAQQDIVNPMTDAKDLPAASVANVAGATNSNKCLVLDVYLPTKRYLETVITPATADSEILSVVAIQYQAGALPTNVDASILASILSVSPVEA